MKKIETLNYTIKVNNSIAFNLLKFSKINFKGSTTILFILIKLFFKNSFKFIINNKEYIWPIESISDFRLLRGDFDNELKSYSVNLGYEGIDLLYIKTLLENDDIVLDLGANKGFYTLFFSSFVGENGKVFSFEATSSNFQKLLFRIKTKWNLQNVIPFNFILGFDNNSLVSMSKPSFFDDGTGFYSKLSNKEVKSSSYTRKLDTILNFFNNQKIKLIKIDVEGAEFNVLSGSIQILKNTDFVLIEVSNTGVERFGHSLNDLYKLMEDNNFNYSYYITMNKDQESVLIYSNRSAGNIIFSKNKLV